MLTPGEKPSEEVIFAFRMMMNRYGLAPSDVMKILVSLDRERGRDEP